MVLNFSEELKILGDLSTTIQKKESSIDDVDDMKTIQQVRANIHVAYLNLRRLEEKYSKLRDRY